jgi:integrase
MVEVGVPLKIVSKILGHSTIQMTERYANPTPDTLRDAVNRLEDVLKTRHKVDTPAVRPAIETPASRTYLYN